MPETLMKSTTVRALRTAMGILEGLAPAWAPGGSTASGSQFRARDRRSAKFRPTTCHLSSWSVERPCAVTAGETTRRSST